MFDLSINALQTVTADAPLRENTAAGDAADRQDATEPPCFLQHNQKSPPDFRRGFL
jgi:hypothetical protein